MHGKKRDSDIHGLHRKKRRSDRSKRTSPRHIRAVHKLLVRDLLFLTDLLDDGNRLAVCRIGLRTRLLDTESSAEHRLVGKIHFPCLVRMDAVCHIHGQQHAAVEILLRRLFPSQLF